MGLIYICCRESKTSYLHPLVISHSFCTIFVRMDFQYWFTETKCVSLAFLLMIMSAL